MGGETVFLGVCIYGQVIKKRKPGGVLFIFLMMLVARFSDLISSLSRLD